MPDSVTSNLTLIIVAVVGGSFGLLGTIGTAFFGWHFLRNRTKAETRKLNADAKVTEQQQEKAALRRVIDGNDLLDQVLKQSEERFKSYMDALATTNRLEREKQTIDIMRQLAEQKLADERNENQNLAKEVWKLTEEHKHCTIQLTQVQNELETQRLQNITFTDKITELEAQILKFKGIKIGDSNN